MSLRPEFFDATEFVRYQFAQKYPEYGYRVRHRNDREFQNSIKNRIGGSMDRLSQEEKRQIENGSTNLGKYIQTAQIIAFSSAGMRRLTQPLQNQGYSALLKTFQKNNPALWQNVDALLQCTPPHVPPSTMLDIAEKITPFLAFAKEIHHLDSASGTMEGIWYLSEFDLAVSYLWGMNGDAQEKVNVAFNTPQELWLQSQEKKFVEMGII